MKKISIFVSGKGGCGKSHSSNVLAQYLKDHVKCKIEVFDTDQVNPTLTEYTSLNVTHFSLIDENKKFNSRLFDNLMERIISSEAEHVVIDTGSNTFMPLLEYASSINIFQQLRDFDCEVIFHLLLCGGDLYDTTLTGVQVILEQFKIDTVIWLNEHFGSLTKFQNEDIFSKNYAYSSLIKGVVLLPAYDKDTFGEDLKVMATKRMTLPEAMKSSDFGIIPRMRLKKVYGDYFKRLDALEILSNTNPSEE